MNANIEKVIKIAEAEVGYLEKKSNSNLDSKTGNAGSNNYTKYARDLDKDKTFYNGPKNGFSWCDVFVDWCFVQAFGADTAKKLLNQPDKSLGAGVDYSYRYYKNMNRIYSSPEVGDQIFFGVSASNLQHTGLVYKVSDGIVYTIEGNSSTSSGVVSNGGGVVKKSYSRSYYKIQGYGRPKWSILPTPSTSTSTTTTTTKNPINTVKEVQKWIGVTVDGDYGPKTKAAIVKYLQKAIGAEPDGIFGNETYGKVKNLTTSSKGNAVRALQALLICNGYNINLNGSYDTATKNAVTKYQKKKGLEVDGIAGKNTFKALCK